MGVVTLDIAVRADHYMVIFVEFVGILPGMLYLLIAAVQTPGTIDIDGTVPMSIGAGFSADITYHLMPLGVTGLAVPYHMMLFLHSFSAIAAQGMPAVRGVLSLPFPLMLVGATCATHGTFTVAAISVILYRGCRTARTP